MKDSTTAGIRCGRPGSNSFHMVIARVVDGAMQIIGRLKQRVHLADGLDSNNMLSEEAMERGLACLSLFAERLQGFDPSSVYCGNLHVAPGAQRTGVS
jgi:exopolyphosphatase/guanosine-5'-triphosphate,3'-diphosphate pyrophosphatase